jgi:hypothetical protein
VFHVRSIFPDASRIDACSFELSPTNAQGQAVCSLFERYLCDRPAEFRDRLSFLKKGNLELDWSAAAGGVALASIYQDGNPAAISVLLSGTERSTDANMLAVFRENVLSPLFGSEFDSVVSVESRPLVVQVIFAGEAEWVPAIQLLSASLASVYFRTVIQLSSEIEGGESDAGRPSGPQ